MPDDSAGDKQPDVNASELDSHARGPEPGTAGLSREGEVDPLAEIAPAPSPTAVLAFLLSLLVPCVPLVGGIFGVVLGLVAHHEIRRSGGKVGGRGLAVAAIALGVVHVGSFGALLVVTTAQAFRSPGAGAPSPPRATAVSAPPPPGMPSSRGLNSGAASIDDETRVVTIGKVKLVDLGSTSSLAPALRQQHELATADGDQLLLWLSATTPTRPGTPASPAELPRTACSPCAGVAAALDDREMQDALAQVRIVRVEADVYRPQLERLGVPADVLPGFTLLDGDLRVRDHIHGGEWDDDIAANIAPVLKRFIRGALLQRRHPWQRTERSDGLRRDDETPL